MQEQSYDPYNVPYDQYGHPTNGAGVGSGAAGVGAGAYDPAQAAYYAQQGGYAQYPPHAGGYGYPGAGGADGYGYDAGGLVTGAGAAGVGAAAAAAGSAGTQQDGPAGNGTGTGSAIAAQMGLRDGMMVRVKVGFVRTLEDELGESFCSQHHERFVLIPSPLSSQPSTQVNNSTSTLPTMTDGVCVKIKLRTRVLCL